MPHKTQFSKVFRPNEGQGTDDHARETASRRRFEFGANWERFFGLVDDTRIAIVQASLK
jgi:hypothetical protein